MVRSIHSRSRLILAGVIVVGLLGSADRCPASNVWTAKTEMPTARCGLGTAVVDGLIYAIGGRGPSRQGIATVEAYDPVTDTWTTRAPMPTARWGFATAAVNGKIYVMGGAKGHPSSAFGTLEEYDPATDTWTTKAPMPTKRTIFGAAVLNERIYAIGGMLPGSVGFGAEIVEVYDPTTDTWKSRTPMNIGRYAHGVAVVDGTIYAIGGITVAPGDRPASIETYDPTTDTWTLGGDMPAPKTFFSASVLNGTIYAVGGDSGITNAGPLVYAYYPTIDHWRRRADLPIPKTFLSTSTADGKMFAIGGSTSPYPWDGTTTVQEYDPGLPAPDFDGDYRIDIDDLVLLIESWGQDDPAVDIAPPTLGDGIVDVQDLELLMGYWGQDVDDPTLIAHWKLDEAEGNIACDDTGENDVVLQGDPLWQPNGGAVDGALEFDGVDDYLPVGFVLDPQERPFSVFAWICGGAPRQVVVSQVHGENWLIADAVTGNLATNLIPPTSRTQAPALVSDVAITDGVWRRIGFTWDGTSRKLYVDDVLVAQDDQNAPKGCLGDLNIGCGEAMTPGTLWSGLIDDVRIYKRAVEP